MYDELGELLFQKNKSTEKTFIVYGTAIEDSENGEVSIQIDNDILNLEDDNEDYKEVNITDELDDTDNLDEDEDDEDEGNEVFWVEDDDYSVEEDSDNGENQDNYIAVVSSMSGTVASYGGIYVYLDEMYQLITGSNDQETEIGSSDISIYGQEETKEHYGVYAFYVYSE